MREKQVRKVQIHATDYVYPLAGEPKRITAVCGMRVMPELAVPAGSMRKPECVGCKAVLEERERDREMHAYMADTLKQWFPWLGTDKDANGADAVDGLNELYGQLRGHRDFRKGKRK